MARRAPAWLMAAAMALLPVAAAAADIELPAQRPSASPTTPASVGVFAPPDATCLEWTDGCRTCQKPPTGEVACSNVGVACVPQAPRCTRR